MKRHLLTFFAFMLCCVMQAATALQMGEVFTVKDGGSDIWTITPTESGVMKIVGDNGDGEWIGSCLVVYADEAMTAEIQSYNWTYYEVNVEAGHTYYIKNANLSFTDYKACCKMSAAFAFVSSQPAEGEPFYIVGDSEAFFYFSQKKVTFKTGELECNGNKVNIYHFNDQNELIKSGIFTYTESGASGIVNYNGNVVGHDNNDGFSIPFLTSTGVSYTNIIYDWLSTGKVEKGQTMTIRLHGVCSGAGELLNGDGELEAHWLVPGLPTTLSKALLPETFLSYWAPGDEKGIAVFEFSNEIKSAEAMIGMGYADASDRFEGEVPVIIEGNKVKVDFTGEKRDANTMGLKGVYSQMELKIYNVIDIDGMGTFAGDQGRASSYDFVLSYRDVSGEVSYDITPATGSSLDGVDNVEIWYQDLKNVIETDGVEIVYYTTEVEKETVTEVVDGVEVTREVEVEVNKEHTIFYGDQELGANWNVGVDGTTITIPVNDEMRNSKNVSVRLHITKNYDGRDHNIVAYYNTQLFHQYEVAITADPVSESTVDRLSEIYLTLGSTYAINEDKAEVEVTSKTNVQFKATGTIIRDGMTNAVIVLDEPITEEGQYTVSVQEGALGDYIYGESGYVAGNCNEAFSLLYAVSGKYAGKEVIASPEDGTTVNKLETVTLTFFNYNSVAPTWNPETEPYIIIDEESEPVVCQFVESTEVSNAVTVKVGTPITADGEYTLVVPAGAVCNAATGNPIGKEYRFTFTVEAAAVVGDLVLNPAPGTYDEIGNILIDFGKPVTIVEACEENNWWVPQPQLLSTDGGWTLYAGGQLMATDNPNVLEWVMDGTAVKGCDAEFTIPEGCVKYADGTLNSSYTFSYTITGANAVNLEIVSTVPEQWSEVEELSEMTVTFDQPVTISEWNNTVSACNAFWTKFATGTISATDDPCTVKIVFEEPIKEYGQTTITIASYTLQVASGKDYDADIYINLTVGEDNSQGGDDPVEDENITITPESYSTVASLKYFEITFGGFEGAWVENPIKFMDPYDNVLATVQYLSGEDADGVSFWEKGQANTYSITLPNEITEDGNYVLYIPAVCEKHDGSTVVRELFYMFEVDHTVGIVSVKALDASEAYTLSGVKANMGKPGLYIVNGKKVLVK